MLLELSIQNFAIIEDLKIGFTKGLNLLTGETGSGKSIIIEALGIVLGGRSTKSLIRTGEKKAVIQALFYIENKEKIEALFQEHGIDMEEDGLVIITREIFTNSPSISRLNGRTVTLGILNSISYNLVDIFGQHEHQSLLHIPNHKTLIDSFGDERFNILKAELKRNFEEYAEFKKQLEKMNINSSQKERQIDLLKFQIQEIQSANLSPADDEDLENQFNRVNNIKTIGMGVGEVLDSLNGDNFENISIIDLIHKNISVLSGLKKYDMDLVPLLQRIEGVGLELQDINKEMRNYMESLDLNEESLIYLTDRMNTVNRLKKKYGNSVEKINEFMFNIQDELDVILNYDKEIKRLNENIHQIEKLSLGLSKELTLKRKAIAKDLEVKITSELQELNMKDIIFKVSFKESKNISADGLDQIEFLISTNPGEELKPLSKIISGGEMSRIMLGFKSILAEYDGIPTLIFDEIDTGISGRTAQVVGEKISKISSKHQVISISHLPQIAALADSHYLIHKGMSNNKSITTITRLTDEERVMEMARILGGVNVTETTMNHAREMLEMTKKLKG